MMLQNPQITHIQGTPEILRDGYKVAEWELEPRALGLQRPCFLTSQAAPLLIGELRSWRWGTSHEILG